MWVRTGQASARLDLEFGLDLLTSTAPSSLLAK
uniref:Uncharacterized protein n=1 Tax=Arundo donax TaxID=35708 RepID=A0A0A9G287_ARUDO